MGRLSVDRIAMMALGGAAGGLVTYFLLEPSLRALEIANEAGIRHGSMAENPTEFFTDAIRLGAVLSLMIGGALIFVEELKSRSPIRIARLVLIGAVVGAVCGAISGILGQILFSILLAPFALTGQPIVGILILARAVGWSLVGAGAGLCPGVVTRSIVRVRQGIVGGLIGGALGGLLFDIIGSATQTGSLSRAIGFVCIGAAVGALVSLIEETAKTHWLTVLTGAKEGRSFILSRPQSLLGRDELTDIPLFGDTTVQKRHALLSVTPGGVIVSAQPGGSLTINGQPVAQTSLKDGDILGIGRHRLLFRSRKTAHPAAMPLPSDVRAASVPGPEYASAFPVASPNGGMPPLPSLNAASPVLSRLEVIAGPHVGAVFPLIPGAIIGRDPRCDIPLLDDGHASRQHARLLPEGETWRIEDGGSVNGLYVNGQRVASALLQPGDQIGIGDSLLRIS